MREPTAVTRSVDRERVNSHGESPPLVHRGHVAVNAISAGSPPDLAQKASSRSRRTAVRVALNRRQPSR